MLRIHPASDGHFDMQGNGGETPDVDCDVVVYGGDGMAPATEEIPEIRKRYPGKTIIAIAGNHSFYSDHRRPELKTTWEYQREHAPTIAALHDVIWLDNGSVVIDDVRFLGCTLWTDFMSRASHVSFNDAARGALRMNDYRLIKTGRGRSGDTLKPRDTINDHKRSVKWLQEQLATEFDGETVVVTHHAPSEKSLMASRPYYDLDWCYASNCEWLMHPYDADNNPHNLAPTHVPPVLWQHGHVHSQHDYVVGDTRVLCNSRGYPAGHHYTWRDGGPRENPNFDDQLVVKIGRDLNLRPGM
jgi:hypothetical protein